MNETQEKELRLALEDELQKQFLNGLRQGSKAMCGVILEKLRSKEMTDTQKVEAIKAFCERSLDIA